MLAHVLREYRINKIFLSCIGCWSFQSKLAKCLLSGFCFILEISYLPFEIFTLYEHRSNGLIIFECCYQMVITASFLVKLLNQFWKRDKFRRLYEIMENHWNMFTNDTEVRTLKYYSLMSQRYTRLYAIIIYSMMSMFIIIPTFMPIFLDTVLPLNESRPRQFAIYAEYGVDKEKYFVPIICYTTVMITVGLTITVATDTMHMVCTAHACSLFHLIGQQIEDITQSADVNDEDDEYPRCANAQIILLNEQTTYQKYIVCLKNHQLAIEFVDVLNDSHKIVGIGLSLLVGATFSLVGVRIVYVLDELQEMIRYFFIIMGALLQLMVLCYSGQKLMDQSQDIFHQVYSMEWYRFSPRLKSLLMITLYRSIIPCKLTAGNLFPLSMTVFAAVVRMGMSYFTTFLSLKN